MGFLLIFLIRSRDGELERLSTVFFRVLCMLIRHSFLSLSRLPVAWMSLLDVGS